MRKVQSQQSVPVRSIIIKDETGSGKVSLWREQLASELLPIDNYISLTNMNIGFYKERYFNSCSTSQLTVSSRFLRFSVVSLNTLTHYKNIGNIDNVHKHNKTPFSTQPFCY